MNIKRGIFLLLLVAASCKNGDDHLPPKVMGKVLLDIHVAEAYSSTRQDANYRQGAKNMDSLAHYYKDIFAHYNITKAQFDNSVTYYKQHPDELDTMYDKIIPELGKLQGPNP